MPDYTQFLYDSLKQKDQTSNQREEPAIDPTVNTTDKGYIPESPEARTPDFNKPEQIEPKADPVAEAENEQAIVDELFRQEKHAYGASQDVELENNPYTWSPEYTQRGYIEEAEVSLARGFGKHVIGGTGDMIQLVNAIIPGWELREGNMLSRGLQEIGKQYEEEYKAYMPPEIASPDFSVKTFMNPNFWTKQVMEYIPQLVEMVLISRGTSSLAKGAARSTVKGLTEGMSKEAMEQMGKKVMVNESERVLQGLAKKSTETLGQGSKGWRSAFMTTEGAATQGLETGAEMLGGGLGMNLVAGLQNSGQLINEMKLLKDDEGNFLYDESQLSQMAATTMTENFKYLPVDMLSYGLIYAKQSGQLAKMMNPFAKAKGGKAFYNVGEQMAASSKSFTAEIRPVMSFMDKVAMKAEKIGEKALNVGRALGKPAFESYEEQIQETYEDWATKKAKQKVTGEDIGYQNSLSGFYDFFMSKENESTRAISGALGFVGGSASKIAETFNAKAEQNFKNYSKVELFKHAATSQDAFEMQSGYLKQEIIDQLMDGNVDTDGFLNQLKENGALNDELHAQWKGIAKEMKAKKETVDAIGNLNNHGKIAFLEQTFNEQVAKDGLIFEKAKKDKKIAALKEQYKGNENNPTYKEQIKETEQAWIELEGTLNFQAAQAQHGALNILSGEKADVTRIKKVQDTYGNTVAVGLSEKEYNDYYNKTNEQVYKDAREKRFDYKSHLKKSGNVLKDFYNSAKEKVTSIIEKGKEAVKKDTESEIETETQEKAGPEAVFAKAVDDIIGSESVKKTIESNGEKGLDFEAKKDQLTDTLKDIVDNEKTDENDVEQYMKDKVGTVAQAVWVTHPKEFADMLDNWKKGKEAKYAKKNAEPGAEPETIEEELSEVKDDINNAPVTDRDKNNQDLKRFIPFSIIEQANKNDKRSGQTAKQIADRGGYSVNELDALLPNWRSMLPKSGRAFKGDDATEAGKKALEQGKQALKDGVQKGKEVIDDLKKKVQTNISQQAMDKAQQADAIAKNKKQAFLASKFTDKNFRRLYKKAIKHDPSQAQKLQDEYDEYLSSTMAKVSMYQNQMTKQMALNYHLRKLFPDTEIQAYSMQNLYAALRTKPTENNPNPDNSEAEKTLGYALMSAILIDEKVWKQEDIFMHEFAHIHFAVTRNEPATIAILKEAMKDKALWDKLRTGNYKGSVMYYYTPENWVPRQGKRRPMMAASSFAAGNLAEQLITKDKNGRPLAMEAEAKYQEELLDEMFARYLQGPLSKEYTKFFIPREDLSRQYHVKNWFKWVKSKTVENQDDLMTLANIINDGKAVDQTTVKSFIMNGFINSMQGKNVTARSRRMMGEEELNLIDKQNKEIDAALEKEFKEFKKFNKYTKPRVLTQSDIDAIGTANYGNMDVDVKPTPYHDPDFPTFDVIQAQIENSKEMHLSTFWDSDFDTANLKNNLIINKFVSSWNADFVDKKSERLEELKKLQKEDPEAYAKTKKIDMALYEGLNKEKFEEGLIDLAKMYDSYKDFIRDLQNSKLTEHKEFIKHLNKEFGDPLTRLKQMHFIYTNQETLVPIMHFTGKDGIYEAVNPKSPKELGTIGKTVNGLKNKSLEDLDEFWKAHNIINQAKILNEDKHLKAAETIMQFYAHSTTIVDKVAKDGYIVMGTKNVPILSAVKQFVKDGLASNGNLKNSAEPFVKALITTGKKFSSTSGVKGANGEIINTRMFSNHAFKMFNKMVVDLKNSENNKEEKSLFMTFYSNSNTTVSEDKYNPVLSSIWDNYHTKGEIPLLALNAGSQNEILGKNKAYKDMSADQQLITEFMAFMDATENGNANYFGSMDTFGDSSRNIVMSMPRNLSALDKNGNLNAKGKADLQKAYDIYVKMAWDKKKFMLEVNQKPVMTFEQYEKSFNNSLAKFEQNFEKHASSYAKYKLFEKFFETSTDPKTKGVTILPKLNAYGKLAVKNFSFNKATNTTFIHEMMSPGLTIDGITKAHKGHVAPVIALDENLRTEMIPMANEYRVPPPVRLEGETKTEYRNSDRYKKWREKMILTNDGIQYILEEDAEQIRRANPDFNYGYKLFSHSIEKVNRWFMNQTAQMKGYTTVLTLEGVTTSSQQHLKPIYDLLQERRKKFTDDYKKRYGEEYNPQYRSQGMTDEKRPKYIGIVTPLSAEKASLFEIPEMDGFSERFNLSELQNPKVMEEYKKLLDTLYYEGENFVGLDGSNFGPQQIMDKEYNKANFSIQAIISVMHNWNNDTREQSGFKNSKQTLKDLEGIQQLLVEQKWVNFQKNVLDYISDPKYKGDDYAYSNLIAKVANKLQSDPYTLEMLSNGYKVYSPHIAKFAINTFKQLVIREGNNLVVPGTYGQTISDMGYKYTALENGESIERFVHKPGRNKTYPSVQEEYVNGTSGLNSYGVVTELDEDGVAFERTLPFEAILPASQNNKNTRARKAFYGPDARSQAVRYLNDNKNVAKELKLLNKNDSLDMAKVDQLFGRTKIYSAKEPTDANLIGLYVPGETVMMTRIPHSGPSFMGVAEVVGFHTTGASNIIVPAEYSALIGADHDGDALFVYRTAKAKDGSIDTDMKEGYGNWNQAFEKLVDRWTRPEVRQTLMVPLKFEEKVDQIISDVKSETNFDVNEDIPFGTESFKENYNNAVASKQTIGIAFHMHRAFNHLAAYKTFLANGFTNGKPNLATIKINNVAKNQFADDPYAKPEDSRVFQSNILANIVMDSKKNGHADVLNLNRASIGMAMTLVNLGYDIKTIGLLLNHPVAKDFISKSNDVANDYLDTGSLTKLLNDYNRMPEYKGAIYTNPTSFDISTTAKETDKANNKEIIKLMAYLSKMSHDISTLTTITSGHNDIESNPFVLQKQIKDVEALLQNKKQDDSTKLNTSTLYFQVNAQGKVNIASNPEISHYIRIAKEFGTHQQKLSIMYNDSSQDILSRIQDFLAGQELTGRALKHYTDMIVPMIYSRLLGANNIDAQEIIDLFEDPETEENIELEDENQIIAYPSEEVRQASPMARMLDEYKKELNDIVHYQNPNNVLEKDTEFTRSRLLNSAIIWDVNGVRLNPQVLQDHYSQKEKNYIRDEFAAMPLKLQRALVLYDLTKYGFTEEGSLYPIFPYSITSFIDKRAEEFQREDFIKQTTGKEQTSHKFNDNVMKQAYNIIQDIEISNPNNNYFPNIYLESPLDYEAEPSSNTLTSFYTKIADNKNIDERPLGKVPFMVNVHYTNKKGDNVTEVVQINPFGNLITQEEADEIVSYRTAAAKESGNWRRIVGDVIKNKTYKGHDLFQPARAKYLKDVTIATPQNIHLITLKDENTNPEGSDIKPPNIMVDQAVTEDDIAHSIKKKRVGRAFQSDYQNFTDVKPLERQQLIDAYQYKQTLSELQEQMIFSRYETDKDFANQQADKYTKAKVKDMDADVLLAAYHDWGRRDAYASAIVMVPIMLELIDRMAVEQSKITGRSQGNDDIPLMKAYFQTNNIDSSHPATQAIQREIETEFKGFIQERKKYLSRIKKVTEELYAYKFGYTPVQNKFFNKVQRAAKLLFKNRSDVYRMLYDNIVHIEERYENGKKQKRWQLYSEEQLKRKLDSGQIGLPEYNFAIEFRKITTELSPNADWQSGGIPSVGMGRLEAFGRKGLLGVLVNSRPAQQAIYDVKMEFEGETKSFKEIEDIFRQDKLSTWETNTQYLKYRRKANQLFKKKQNEDGTRYRHSEVFNHTILSDGMYNEFENGGWVDEDQMLSLDLNKALSDFTHVQLFIEGNGVFKGFKNLQAKVDGLLLFNNIKGFKNQNEFVRKVYKEYFLKAKKLNPDSSSDKLMDAIVKGNLLYIMGWKLAIAGKGLYAVGNVIVGKYNNIKNHGGAVWLKGEQRYWGVGPKGFGNRKASGVLKTLNFSDMNLYDDVSMEKSQGLDSIFSDIAFLPMQASEHWIQGAHFLGLLTEEQWNMFDENGNYKPGTTAITNPEITRLENTVKNAHGKGYTPTDQRLIQRYSWGRAIMQFSRFIPTMFYDRFAKEDINIYGEKHIGSLRAVYDVVAKFTSGEIPMSKYKEYIDAMDIETRARFYSGLRGLAMVSVALIAGEALNMGAARELAGDANYLVNADKLEFKMMPSAVRTIADMLSVFAPGSDVIAPEANG